MYLDYNSCLDDKNAEIPKSDIENHKIGPDEVFQINACGRSDAAVGTAGGYDIYEDGGPKVRHFYWDCPWGSKTNTWRVTGMKHPLCVRSHEQLD